MRDDLRVPTVAIPAEVFLDGGEKLTGQVFLPSISSHHSGQPRPDEWLNQPTGFFPFLIDGDERALILNKSRVAAVTFPKTYALSPDDSLGFTSQVEVHWDGSPVKGSVLIDMPAERTRMLDYLNGPDRFIPIWASDSYQLIRKDCITRIIEREG